MLSGDVPRDREDKACRASLVCVLKNPLQIKAYQQYIPRWPSPSTLSCCFFYNPTVSFFIQTPPSRLARLTGPIFGFNSTLSSFTLWSSVGSYGGGLTTICTSCGARTGLLGSGISSGRTSASSGVMRLGDYEICSMLSLRMRSRREGRTLRRGRSPSMQRQWWMVERS